MDFVAYCHGASGALCNNYHKMSFSVYSCNSDAFCNIAFKIKRLFRNKHCRCAGSQAHIKCKVTRVSSHNLNNRAPFVRLHCVAQAVHRLNCGVRSRIKPYGIICAGNVIVYCCRNAHSGNSVFGKFQKSAEGSVAAYGHKTVYSEKPANLRGFFSSLLCAEFFAARGIKHRSATVYYA